MALGLFLGGGVGLVTNFVTLLTVLFLGGLVGARGSTERARARAGLLLLISSLAPLFSAGLGFWVVTSILPAT